MFFVVLSTSWILSVSNLHSNGQTNIGHQQLSLPNNNQLATQNTDKQHRDKLRTNSLNDANQTTNNTNTKLQNDTNVNNIDLSNIKKIETYKENNVISIGRKRNHGEMINAHIQSGVTKNEEQNLISKNNETLRTTVEVLKTSRKTTQSFK